MLLMAEWLEQASEWHEMYCYGLEIVSLNPGRIYFGVRVVLHLNQKLIH